MKRLIYLTLLFVFVLFSCENDNSSSTNFDEASLSFEKAFDNKIFENTADGPVQLSKEDFLQHWDEKFEWNNQYTFKDIKLVKARVEEGEEQYYMVQSLSDDNTITVSSKVMLDSKTGQLKFTGETCTCESNGCNSGCEVFTMCTCTSCFGGKCTKKHVVTGGDN